MTLDGVLLEKVGVRIGGKVYGDSASSVGPGAYFVDYDAGTVSLGSTTRTATTSSSGAHTTVLHPVRATS